MKPTLSREYRVGIFLMLGSTFLISCSDTFSKLMTAQVSVMQIALVQSVVMMAAVPFMVKTYHLPSILRTKRIGIQLLRSACQLTSALLFIYGLKKLPLADIVALIFVGPLIVTLLSSLILKERVGMARWLACLVGFMGALIVIRPGFGSIGWDALFPIGATSIYSIYIICTRSLAPHERHGTMLFYSALVSVVALSVSAPIYWVNPSINGWLGLLCVGILSCASAVFAIAAYARAPASMLAPFAYVEIISATAFGFLIFNDVPDVLTLVGAAIVIASGLYVYRHGS